MTPGVSHQNITPDTRRSISLVSFVLTALSHHGVPISDTVLDKACAAMRDNASEPNADTAQELVSYLNAA